MITEKDVSRMMLSTVSSLPSLPIDVADDPQSEGGKFFIFLAWQDLDAVAEEMNKVYMTEAWVEPVCFGFADSYAACCVCNTLIATEPDSYHWQPDFFLTDSGPCCCDCTRSEFAEEYVLSHLNENRLLNSAVVSPRDHGFEALDLSFESGLHPGQNSDPQAVVAVLNAAGIDCLFSGVDVGQFSCTWKVWVESSKKGRAAAVLRDANTDLPYDTAEELQRVLFGGRSQHVRVIETILTPEEFERGWKPEDVAGPGVNIQRVTIMREDDL